MKRRPFLKVVLTMIIIGLTSCSNTNEVEVSKVSACEEIIFNIQIDNNIPALIKEVEEGQSFYKGIKIYYEVDAELYLPQIFELENRKFIRIFPVDGLVAKIGDTKTIKGELSSCVTGNHGLLTNDLKSFYIISKD